jgi:hypothetical protein
MRPQKLDVTGKRFDITKERVRQIQNDAIENLKALMRKYLMGDCLWGKASLRAVKPITHGRTDQF